MRDDARGSKGQRPGRRKTSPRARRAADLTLLGAGRVPIPPSPDEARLETFGNDRAGRNFVIEFDCPEFTCMCPITGQPDFGHIVLRYVPSRRCIESKSLKLYLHSFRNHGSFHEEVVNRVLADVVAACDPIEAEVEGRFRPRGGISLRVIARHPGIRRTPRLDAARTAGAVEQRQPL